MSFYMGCLDHNSAGPNKVHRALIGAALRGDFGEHEGSPLQVDPLFVGDS